MFHEPLAQGTDEQYTHLRFSAKAQEGRPAVVVCVDTGYGRPFVSREWLQTLDQTVEKRRGAYVKGINDTVGNVYLLRRWRQERRKQGRHCQVRMRSLGAGESFWVVRLARQWITRPPSD